MVMKVDAATFVARNTATVLLQQTLEGRKIQFKSQIDGASVLQSGKSKGNANANSNEFAKHILSRPVVTVNLVR